MKHLLSWVRCIWNENPVSTGLLGICSALAVSGRMSNALAMGSSVLLVLLSSAFFISLLRRWIPLRLRLIVVMLIVSVFVIISDRLLQLWFPAISHELGPYVGLIITNCIILGRAEACFMRSALLPSLADALFHGIAYTSALLCIAFFRELLGFGSLFGIALIPEGWPKIGIMTMAPGAFFVLTVMIWLAHRRPRR